MKYAGWIAAATALSAVALVASRRSSEPDGLLVFAAASLRDVCVELERSFTAEEPSRILFNFAGSNELAEQLLAGARADLVLSADEFQLDRIESAGLLAEDSRRALLSNTLVVVAPSANTANPVNPDDQDPWTPASLGRVERIALAHPDAVPAGRYARAWLEREGVWDALEGRVVPAPHVRGVLAMVAAGGAPFGIVYATDAGTSDAVRVVFAIPEADTPPIRYPVARIAHSEHEAEARAFLAFLAGDEARAIFERHGFGVIADGE